MCPDGVDRDNFQYKEGPALHIYMNDRVSLIDFMIVTDCWYSNSTPPCNCVVLGCEILEMSFKYASLLCRERRTLKACGDS
jgi:hypothetical protein